jgi:ParB family chromosome partitioning protein
MILTDIPTNRIQPHPDNPRADLRGIDDLAASIAEVGILQPLVVQPDGDGYVIHLGHRRHAAAQQAGLLEVPCLVGDCAGQVQAITAMLSENIHRDDLTTSEQAAGFAQLALLGLGEADIARVTATPRAKVAAALVLHRLPAAAHQAADSGALDLEDAARLAGLPDDVAARILAKPLNPWGLRHDIQTAKNTIARKAAIDELTAELTAAGVSVVKKPGDYPYGQEAPAYTLLDSEGTAVDPEQVKTVPGFAAFIDCPQGSCDARAVIVCLDPEAAGLTRTAHTKYRSPQAIEQERAEREAVESREAAFQAAAQVRWEFVQRTYGSAKAAKGMWLTTLRAIIDDPDLVSPREDERAYVLAGIPDDVDLQQAGLDRVSRLLVCRYLVAQEENLACVMGGVYWHASRERALQWLDLLVEAGYTLSDVETELRTHLVEDTADEEADSEAGDGERAA